jgi:hypothetical protein
MNLNNLKPAWHQFRLLNSLQSIDKDEILLILERAEDRTINNTYRLLISSIVFAILTICCQGG